MEDMRDPVDMLLAMTEDPTKGQARPLDFVRSKFKDMKSENKRLRERVTDLEQTLSIVQTAQEWTLGKGMTQEQAEKMREIKALLEQVRRRNVIDADGLSGSDEIKRCWWQRGP